ncbi:MAG: hypothetical protein JWP74_919 [Marmoricola sp.]|nr:hypothetical protein [Marmoricola sp.]
MTAIGELEAEIALTRDQLAGTVSALSDRLDVGARLHESADHAKRAAASHKPALIAATGLAALGLAAFVLWRRRS